MYAVHLRTEYLRQPIGIDTCAPRFGWHCEKGVRQSAYQIRCFFQERMLWDSGKVISSKMTHIAYEGEKLCSGMGVCWEVRLWDENDAPGKWQKAYFEMGFLERADWKGKWISGDYDPKAQERYPVDCFRKKFSLTGSVKSARLTITARGVYKAFLNQSAVGDMYLAPGTTDYRKRIQYQVYDITDLLREENEEQILTVELADGWYRGGVSAWGITCAYGIQTSFLCQLDLFYTDGRKERIVSDETFDWSNDGPLRFADLRDGEIYDASRKPSYGGYARVCEDEGDARLVSAQNVMPKEQEIFIPTLLHTPSGKTVLDFGQNIAGILKFCVKGEKGQKIFLRMGETLDEAGEFTQKNFQLKRTEGYLDEVGRMLLLAGEDAMQKPIGVTPRQEIVFYCSGEEDCYHTSFSILGFRYVLVESDIEINPQDFRAAAVYSDMEQTGDFSCSSEKINRLFHNALWSMKGNFMDVPTDCPTRERLGWTGDAQIFFDTGAYMMDVASMYRKYMLDMEDGQKTDGIVSAIVPYSAMDVVYDATGGSVGWADAQVLIPYRFWKRYGDGEILRRFYPAMRRYAMYMIEHTGFSDRERAQTDPNSRYVYEKGIHLGEWLEPEEFCDDVGVENVGALAIPKTEEATAYLHYTMQCMKEIAKELGEEEDEELFLEYANGSAEAYESLFLHPVPDTDRQAKLVRPLALGLAKGKIRQQLQKRLAEAVENRGYRIGTGFLSTPFVLPVLTEANRSDLAYRMLENEELPGWLYEVNHGATTIWESWEGKDSLNHYSPGSVCGWLFDTVCGIRVAGENRFEICPVPGGTLTWAKASYRSIYGPVAAGWEKMESGIRLTVHIPPNTTAVVRWGGKTIEIGAGVTRLFSAGDLSDVSSERKQ